jgi:hypothetical protein
VRLRAGGEIGDSVNENVSAAIEDESRRRFLKKAAVATFAAPVVVTMLSNSASAGHVSCGTVTEVVGGVGTCSGATTCGTQGVCTPSSLTVGAACVCQHP